LREAPLPAAMKSRLKQNRNSFFITAKVRIFYSLLKQRVNRKLIDKAPPQAETKPQTQLTVLICHATEFSELESLVDIQ
jgi:hypothetical protein